VAGTVLTIAQLLQKYYFMSDPVRSPPCASQSPLGTLTTGQNQTFPQLKPLP
jgi:hypothetical protein